MASLCKRHISHLHTHTDTHIHMVSLIVSSNIFSSPVKSHFPSPQPESANGFVNLSTSFTAAVNLEQCTLSDVQVSFIKQDLWFHPLDLQMGFIVIYACVMKDHIKELPDIIEGPILFGPYLSSESRDYLITVSYILSTVSFVNYPYPCF